MRRRLESGQAIILVLVAMGLFLLGALGLAIDVSHMYAQRQMAQNAADAAARAAIMSIFTKTNTTATYSNGFGGAELWCDTAAKENLTPCYYAKQGGFSYTNGDTIHVTFPGAVPSITLAPGWTPGAVHVTVMRPVQTSLMHLLGPSSASIAAEATAAIIQELNPVPILVLYPHDDISGAFTRGGGGMVQICGGPRQSVQVNSTSTTSIVDNGGGPGCFATPPSACIDLSKAGPKASKTGGIPNCDGQGADFGDLGGPSAYNPSNKLLLGTDGSYRQPKGPIYDPFRDIPTPSDPGPPVGANPMDVPNGSPYGCPALPPKPCKLYKPGTYTGGLEVKNEYALFMPGLYYMNGGGFHGAAGSTMKMATCPQTPIGILPQIDPLPPDFGCGMMVYSTGNANKDIFDVGANGDATLLGSTDTGTYQGILFFEDHNSAGHIGVSGGHKLGGGGNLSLTGTIYLTNATAANLTAQTPITFQELVLRGNSGNTTNIIGQIVVDVLDLGGGGTIKMILDPDRLRPVDKVALVK